MPNIISDTHIFSDKPTRDDHLNFKDYAQILADIALNSETPTTIGIFGEWGSGKSSLMMMLDDLLNENNVRTIWFNAWKYDKEDALWRSMILRILDGLDAKKGDVEDIRRKLYTAISSEELGKIEINWLEAGKSLTKQGIKVAGTIAFPLAGIGNIIANIGKTVLNTKSIDDISKAVTRQTIERSQDRITSIEEFDKLYSDLIAKLLGKNERLVVFIDDLDRCSPLQALLVLESLKSFLAAERCIYVVACDPRLIQKGFEKKYGASGEQEVSDYLEKIIQIYFEIPPLRAEDTESFLAKLGVGNEAKVITQIVISSLESNPRKLKRFLNNVEIQHRLVLSRKLGIEKNVLIKMACISYGWKPIWSQVLETPSLLTELQKHAVDKELENKVGINPVVKEIFEKNARLNSFLSQQPYFSEADVDAYIFLARATQAEINKPAQTKLSSEQGSNRNPYTLLPVQSEMFFNRSKELSIARSHLLTSMGSALSVNGQRRIGKTSFLRQIDWLLKNEGALPVYIDLQGYFGFVENSRMFLYLIAQSIVRAQEDVLGGISVFNNAKDELGYVEFDGFITEAFHVLSRKPIVLLFDEFEMVFERISEGKFEIKTLDYLRSLVAKFPQFKMVFCSSRSLSEIARTRGVDSLTSPFYNIAYNIKLSVFDPEAAVSLIREPARDVDYDSDALDYFIQQTGGHPYYIQLISGDIFEALARKGLRFIKKDDVEMAIQNILPSGERYFQPLINEKPLFDFVVKIANFLEQGTYRFTLNDLMQNSEFSDSNVKDQLLELCSRDIFAELRKQEEDNLEYKFVVPLFARWIREYKVRK